MTDDRLETYKRQIEHILAAAKRDGVVITVSLEPKKPLAMGSYEMVCETRLSNISYRLGLK
jgi:hypothetical protein